jgi:spore germination cell wall hydrolase CwlJ-like protein
MMPKSTGVRSGIVAGAMLAAGAVAVGGAAFAARSATEARAEARAVADLRQAAVDAYASAAETSPRVIAVASEPVAAPVRTAARRALPSLGAAPDSERRCLAEAVYFEANGESEAGQRAVAAVILNRTADPRYPKTICGVVYQGAQRSGCQFSFACDGIHQTPSGPGWNRARRIADQALAGAFRDPTHGATHFHATYVAPGWANRLIETAAIGLHVFYRYPGFGRAAAPAPARSREQIVTPTAAPAPDDAVVISIDATPAETASPQPTVDAGPAPLAMTVDAPTPAPTTGGEPQAAAPAASQAAG